MATPTSFNIDSHCTFWKHDPRAKSNAAGKKGVVSSNFRPERPKAYKTTSKTTVIAVAPWSIAVPVENAQGCKSTGSIKLGPEKNLLSCQVFGLDRLVERWETLTKEPRSGCLKKQPQASVLAALLLSDCTAPVRFRFYASSASFSRPLRLLG